MSADVGDTTISIPVGITIGLLASCVQSLGLTIQRKSHVLNQALPEGEQRVEHRRPLWLIGFAIFISSNILGSIFQIASLPVVILAPLGAVSLLWNAFFARFLLGDVFSPWMILGTLLIAGGAVLIAVFGIVPEPTHSLEDLLRLFQRPAFIIYFSILGLVVASCLVVTHITEYSRRLKSPPTTPPLSPTLLPVEPVTTLLATERTPLLDRKRASSSRSRSAASSPTRSPSPVKSATGVPLFLATSYASVSGILSGMCLLFAKSGVELLLLTIGGDNQFWRWQAWVLVLGLAVFALLQLWYLNKGLVLADPTVVCPLAFCFYNLSSIVNGLVYFDQFSLIPPLSLGFVSLGIVILLGGVWVVSFYAGAGLETWHEDESALEDIESPPDSTQGQENSSITGRVVVTEPEEEEDRGRRTYSSDHARVHTNSQLLRGPASPVSRHSVPSAHSNRRRPLLTVDLHHAHGHSHSPASPPLGASGFTIGLSPMSPGFSVMPRERRRRVSSQLSNSGSNLVEGEGERVTGLGLGLGTATGGKGVPMRRSASEGAVGRDSERSVDLGDAEANVPLLEGEDDRDGDGQQPGLPEGAVDREEIGRRRAKARWSWFTGAFGRGRRS